MKKSEQMKKLNDFKNELEEQLKDNPDIEYIRGALSALDWAITVADNIMEID